MSDRSADKLLSLYRDLPEDRKAELLRFAEFLHQHFAKPAVPAEIQSIPRPEQESVIKAMQRLRATYPMLDAAILLDEASTLMSQHVIQGREAKAVIDDLEKLFRRHYDGHVAGGGKL
jgi:precorrin-3B methylase